MKKTKKGLFYAVLVAIMILALGAISASTAFALGTPKGGKKGENPIAEKATLVPAPKDDAAAKKVADEKKAAEAKKKADAKKAADAGKVLDCTKAPDAGSKFLCPGINKSSQKTDKQYGYSKKRQIKAQKSLNSIKKDTKQIPAIAKKVDEIASTTISIKGDTVTIIKILTATGTQPIGKSGTTIVKKTKPAAPVATKPASTTIVKDKVSAAPKPELPVETVKVELPPVDDKTVDANKPLVDATKDATGKDVTAPVLIPPKDVVKDANGNPILIMADTKFQSLVVEYSVTATDDRDPNPVVVCDVASGSAFKLGTTKVTCTATDNVGNKSTGFFGVYVPWRGDVLWTGIVAAQGQGDYETVCKLANETVADKQYYQPVQPVEGSTEMRFGVGIWRAIDEAGDGLYPQGIFQGCKPDRIDQKVIDMSIKNVTHGLCLNAAWDEILGRDHGKCRMNPERFGKGYFMTNLLGVGMMKILPGGNLRETLASGFDHAGNDWFAKYTSGQQVQLLSAATGGLANPAGNSPDGTGTIPGANNDPTGTTYNDSVPGMHIPNATQPAAGQVWSPDNATTLNFNLPVDAANPFAFAAPRLLSASGQVNGLLSASGK